jgi:hypothetical protein
MRHRIRWHSVVSASCALAGCAGLVKQHLQIKQRDRGLNEAGYVESFLVLNALGGDGIEDFERLRADEGLAEMSGHEVPSCAAARKVSLRVS